MSIGRFDTNNITKQTSVLSWLTWGLTTVLFVWGFICPPKGDIPESVLKASCILLAMLGIIVAREAFHEGFGAKITHGQTSVEFSDKDKKEDKEPRDINENFE